jgi:cytochrome c553
MNPRAGLWLLPLLSLFAVARAGDADLRHGANLFSQCASCHGADGAGAADGSTPRIAGQHQSVVRKQLDDFRSGRRVNFRMSELADRHHLATPQDVADVAIYVSQLPAAGQRGLGDGTRATAGALLFGARCASCHRADGGGNAAKAVPRLAGQHYGYLVRQMYDAVDGRRPALPQLHATRIEPLDYDQVRGIADYLSRIER